MRQAAEEKVTLLAEELPENQERPSTNSAISMKTATPVWVSTAIVDIVLPAHTVLNSLSRGTNPWSCN